MINRNLSKRWRTLPKIDLHRHLEGAVRLATIRDAAREMGITLPTENLGDLQDHVQVRKPMPDLKTLLDAFVITQSTLGSSAILERVAFEAVEDAFHEGIHLLELRYSPGFIHMGHPRLTYDSIHDAILKGVRRAQDQYKVRVGLICIISRDTGFETAEKTADFATANRSTFVGFDLAGDELGFDARLFKKYFKRVKDQGLGITVHAGEARVAHAADFVRHAIHDLGADRIGHGLLIVQDPTVMDYVRTRNVVLELCPVSNYLTSAAQRPENHPFRRLMEAGIRVTVNSDDPGLFGTSLNDDYEMLHTYQRLTENDFKKCNQTAAEASFVK